MSKALLLLHGAAAAALAGAAIHNAMTCYRRLRGQQIATRLLRSYSLVSALLCLLVLLLGAVIYPEFRTEIRPGFDLEMPQASLLFEIKEHVAVSAAALLVAQAGLRRGPTLGGRLADWLGVTAVGGVLFAGVVGGWLVTLEAL
ncbi:MAG: hypothetical protein AAGD10_21845 [Myxococcota bacterium]